MFKFLKLLGLVLLANNLRGAAAERMPSQAIYEKVTKLWCGCTWRCNYNVIQTGGLTGVVRGARSWVWDCNWPIITLNTTGKIKKD